jgi:hypothetical protein
LKDGVEANRKICLKQQTELRQKLLSAGQYRDACQLFFKQHAMLHSAKMALAGLFSLEDGVFDELSEEKARRIPQNSQHSIIWNIWHIARIEDVAMNLLVAGSPQILNQDNWLTQMKIKTRDTGNAMEDEVIADLSKMIDIEALRAYRVAVGRRTREIVYQLQPQELKNKVDPARLDQVRKDGAVAESARGIIDYWSKRNIAGLLLMPATRHNLVHLNESFRLKEKRY